MTIRDDEWSLLGCPDTTESVLRTYSVYVDSVCRQHRLYLRECTGGEAEVEYELDIALDGDNVSLMVGGEGRLYEGAGCHATQLEDSDRISEATIAEEESRKIALNLVHKGLLGDDAADILITIVNNVGE